MRLWYRRTFTTKEETVNEYSIIQDAKMENVHSLITRWKQMETVHWKQKTID